MRIYFDTCIWLDFYFKRGYHSIVAYKLFQVALATSAHVFVSDIVVKELKHLGLPMDAILAIFSVIKPIIHHLHASKMQIEESVRLGEALQVPRSDVLHAILARDADSVLVTRDRHFKRLRFVATSRPEELL